MRVNGKLNIMRGLDAGQDVGASANRRPEMRHPDFGDSTPPPQIFLSKTSLSLSLYTQPRAFDLPP